MNFVTLHFRTKMELRVRLVFLLVVGLNAALLRADDDHAEASINFKEDTFADQVPKKPHFVMFFAPW